MDVRINYQPYLSSMSVFVGNTPIGITSSISVIQTQPFHRWWYDLLPRIENEVNDNFTLTYTGRRCEYNLLLQRMSDCPACQQINYAVPANADSTLLRLKKLNRLAINGLDVQRSAETIHIYTDYLEDDIRPIVQSLLPHLSFLKIRLEIHPASEAKLAQNALALAVFSGRVRQSAVEEASKAVNVILYEGADTPCAAGQALVLPFTSDGMEKDINAALEFDCYPAILKMALQLVTVSSADASFDDVFVLDKTEAVTLAELPSSIELGTTAPIRLRAIPATLKEPEIMVEVSNEEVLSPARTPQGWELKAVGTGEAVVTLYEEGKTSPLCSKAITAYRVNWAQSISIDRQEIALCVGEGAYLSCTVSPDDAADAGKIRLKSPSSTCVQVTGHDTFKAVGAGTAKLFFATDRVKSDICTVTVYPRLENLQITLEQKKMKAGDLIPVKILRIPEVASLDSLKVTVSNPSVGAYDAGSKKFFARAPGHCELVVTSNRSPVKAVASIDVHKKSNKWIWIGIGAAVAAVGFVLIRFL